MVNDEGVCKMDCWRTSDGKLHRHEPSARTHQFSINQALEATEMLETGMSVGDCLKAVGYPAEIQEILYSVTSESKLVVSHWQCRDTPGYKPIRFLPGLSMRVWGDAGSWSGPYGGTVKLADLVQYALHKNSELNPEGDQ